MEQGNIRSLVFGMLGLFPALVQAATFTEADRQKYLSCASDTNESASCSSSEGQSSEPGGRGFLGRKPQISKNADSGAKGKFRSGSHAHWNCLGRELNRCMKKSGMSADAQGFIKDRMKLWRMLRPNRARLPENEEILHQAVGRDLDAAKKHMASRYFENPDFKSCLKDARTGGVSAEDGKITAKEFQSGKDSSSGEVIPASEVRDALLACADKKKTQRELASKTAGAGDDNVNAGGSSADSVKSNDDSSGDISSGGSGLNGALRPILSSPAK